MIEFSNCDICDNHLLWVLKHLCQIFKMWHLWILFEFRHLKLFRLWYLFICYFMGRFKPRKIFYLKFDKSLSYLHSEPWRKNVMRRHSKTEIDSPKGKGKKVSMMSSEHSAVLSRLTEQVKLIYYFLSGCVNKWQIRFLQKRIFFFKFF